MTLQCVKFIAKSGKYNANDIAGFRPHEAKRYVEGGKAVYWDPNPPDAAESPEKAAEPELVQPEPKPKSKPKPESGDDDDRKSARAARRRVRSMEADEGKGYETKDG